MEELTRKDFTLLADALYKADSVLSWIENRRSELLGLPENTQEELKLASAAVRRVTDARFSNTLKILDEFTKEG